MCELWILKYAARLQTGRSTSGSKVSQTATLLSYATTCCCTSGRSGGGGGNGSSGAWNGQTLQRSRVTRRRRVKFKFRAHKPSRMRFVSFRFVSYTSVRVNFHQPIESCTAEVKCLTQATVSQRSNTSAYVRRSYRRDLCGRVPFNVCVCVCMSYEHKCPI